MKILRGNAANTLKNLWAAGEAKSRVFAMNIRDQAVIDRAIFVAEAREELRDNDISADDITRIVDEINKKKFNEISAEIFAPKTKTEESEGS